jgi:hypothetical protein
VRGGCWRRWWACARRTSLVGCSGGSETMFKHLLGLRLLPDPMTHNTVAFYIIFKWKFLGIFPISFINQVPTTLYIANVRQHIWESIETPHTLSCSRAELPTCALFWPGILMVYVVLTELVPIPAPVSIPRKRPVRTAIYRRVYNSRIFDIGIPYQ